MSARKSERLVNLLIALLVSRSYVSKARLREVIDEYREARTEDAFEKMFERDKEDLRALGVPIETGSYDPLFEDEQGYRIVREQFELPDIDLSAAEAAVVGLAARVWQHAGLAAATSQALVKLKAAGIDTDREALDIVQPRLAVEEPTFEPLFDAAQSRMPVRFAYRKAGEQDVELRELQPWGMSSYRNRWYVVGLDTGRGSPRVFRLSRIAGDVATIGDPGSFVVPAGTDLRALTEQFAGDTPRGTALVKARAGTALALRRTANRLGSETDPNGGTWDLLVVPRGWGLLDDLLSYGADVVVVEPPELRTAAIAALRSVAASTSGGAS